MVINDLCFKGRRSVDWNIVEKCLKEYIGQCAEITETSDMVYIGADFPDEFAHSRDTKELRGANMYAKANSSNIIKEVRDLYNLVLKDIQDLAAMALKDADVFYQRLSSRMERRYMADASEMQKECDRLEARNQEIDSMFMSLYTDKAKGILTEQRFLKLTATLEQEQETNRKRIQELVLVMRRTDEQESDVRTFMQEIRKYATIQELDEAVLNRLISKILVGEVRKLDGQKLQEVKIIYNFVGEIVSFNE